MKVRAISAAERARIASEYDAVCEIDVALVYDMGASSEDPVAGPGHWKAQAAASYRAEQRRRSGTNRLRQRLAASEAARNRGV